MTEREAVLCGARAIRDMMVLHGHMAGYVGRMALPDYSLFTTAPIAARKALVAAWEATHDQEIADICVQLYGHAPAAPATPHPAEG